MAKLNNDRSTLQFAAAVTAMSIGTGKRLIRNFHYYRQQESASIHKIDCLRIYREIRLNMFGLQNLYLDDNDVENETSSSFKIVLAKQIQDGFEDLHRKILFFDAELIKDLIPILDKYRSFWSASVMSEFYSSELPNKLDRHLISDFPEIECLLDKLPECSDF